MSLLVLDRLPYHLDEQVMRGCGKSVNPATQESSAWPELAREHVCLSYAYELTLILILWLKSKKAKLIRNRN